ncbi:NEL-type E3 ubiquitin ligase domain-containing protein [Pseudomonas fluorescens]|uniref:RING-type E3 ubiquitin transferase n=1 Tax=Pseudomonas fluorescens TaxID=294 RepID=A0A423LSB1_PSEFL|nr:NEL-type E3 ubiquitin ligase domain-containing protein [Pseudomonas fluorescens]RON71208.1 hypothetical protein BK671_03320 [Pseudomonas fluorescens]
MSDVTPLASPLNKGKHHALIKASFSDCFQSVPPRRTEALTRLKLKFEHWHTRDTELREANKQAWITQNRVDRFFSKVQNVQAFAAPLLQARLKEKYGVEDDVQSTFLRLYIPKNSDWWVIDTSAGVTTRTVSLLDAALHNFASNEAFTDDSTFISQPDVRGHFTIKPIKSRMSVKQFQALCRELDIGQQYTAHLKETLQSPGIVARESLKAKLLANETAALTAAAALARLKGDITADAHRVVTQVLAGAHKPVLKGKVMGHSALSLLGTTLTGIVIFGTADKLLPDLYPVIAYVPHDPDHPLKLYSSHLDFLRELSRQLRENRVSAASGMSYRQFFSQFVDHQQRGHFFTVLQSQLSSLAWHSKEPLDQRPSWREEAVAEPDLQHRRIFRSGPLAEQLYQRKIDKVLRDARDIAVSTADADSQARKTWWDNVLKIAADLFNVALLVVTPFVPVIGQMMLAYTAYQLSCEVIEGVVDLAEGQWVEATEHLIGVLNEVAQMAALGAGMAIGQIVTAKFSAFVDGMLPVKSATGKTRLWNPDLAPYQHPQIDLPLDAKPAQNGLYAHKGKQILRKANKHYEVARNSETGEHFLQHPTRSDAYQPRVELNGAGAHVLAFEQPRSWDNATLLRRIGPSVERLSDAQLETARLISATDPGELRAMYIDNQHAPVLLTDTLERLSIDQDIQTFIEHLSSDDPQVYGKADAVTQLQVLTAHDMWPEKASMRIIDGHNQTIWAHTGTEAPAGKKLVVQLQERQLRNGELLKIVMETLDENGTSVILDLPADQLPASLDVRTRALRKRLVAVTESERAKLFDEDYASRTPVAEPLTQKVTSTFPEIAPQGVKNLLAKAGKNERKIITEKGRLPLRLKTIARDLQLETRTARSHEGFYRDALITADTERLTLNALRLYSDALGDLRIEIRADSIDGELRCKAGPDDAGRVRILIRYSGNRYEVCDAAGNTLHEAADLYRSVLQALPKGKLAALGYQPQEGEMFKQWVMVKTESAATRRIALDDRGPLPPPARENLLLVRGPALSRWAATLEERVSDLYPHFSDQELRTFIESLQTTDDPAATLDRLEKEIDDLHVMLRQWQFQQLDSWAGTVSIRNNGQHIIERLVACFERKSTVFGKRSAHLEEGYALDLSTEIAQNDLDLWWNKLPELGQYLEQITTLNLDNTRFSTDTTGLLKDFRHVRQFSARQCGLSEIPQSIGNMHLLETLRLSDNQIHLAAADVERLRNLTRLEIIRLDNNPLGSSVNVGRMPRLRVLSLNNTGIETWPEGLFDKRRPRSFFLDMQQNPISRLPQVVAGSDQALIIARTRIFTESLSDANRIAYRAYRKSVGIDPNIYYSDVADKEMRWWTPDHDVLWNSQPPGLGALRPEAWSDLEMDVESEGLFKVIKKLHLSADYQRGGEARQQLADRVWRLIDAAYLDAGLREELYIMSTAPVTCADAGAQLFNNMGIKVLVSEAYSASTTHAQLQGELVKLATGAARLERVNAIAEADIASRDGTPDEVEVHLAYETGLAVRLNLPWQSQRMLSRQVAGVSDAAIARAYDTVIELEQGDGLVNGMLDQSFWSHYLRENWPAAFRNNALTYEGKADLLDQLRLAQKAWVDAKTLPEAQKAPIRQHLKTLADAFPLPQSEVFTGAAMTEQTYERLISDLGYNEQELGRRLTRAALKKAKE